MQRTFYIATFGCQMNHNDSDVVAGLLCRAGYAPAPDLDAADIFLINTCSVRQHAETRVQGYLTSHSRWRSKPGRMLGILGCMARRLGNEIIRQFPYVDLVLGPDNYARIGEYVEKILEDGTKIVDISDTGTSYCGLRHTARTPADFISIMRGCDNFCSYCIVPYVRGRTRSRPPADIIAEAMTLVSAGVKDITLLGQNVNEYSHEGTDFAGLLRALSGKIGNCRLRFLTSHPKDLDRATIEVVRDRSNLCEWFHLPLQSGSDRILTAMNRKYSREKYLDTIGLIRKAIPEATISTDIMVGFPTETSEDFEATMEIVRALRFDNAYMYRYSVRPGTAAASQQSLAESVVQQRLRHLIAVQNQIFLEHANSMVGKTYEVLFESPCRNGTRGKTRGNTDVIVEQSIVPGTLAWVKITRVSGATPIGILAG